MVGTVSSGAYAQYSQQAAIANPFQKQDTDKAQDQARVQDVPGAHDNDQDRDVRKTASAPDSGGQEAQGSSSRQERGGVVDIKV